MQLQSLPGAVEIGRPMDLKLLGFVYQFSDLVLVVEFVMNLAKPLAEWRVDGCCFTLRS